jgi:hypothetical protein
MIYITVIFVHYDILKLFPFFEVDEEDLQNWN